MASSAEGLGEGRSDRTRSENGNLHGDIMTELSASQRAIAL